MIDSASDAAIWDEVEHGSYGADLELWEELAAANGPVLDLGCGTGRVALALVRLGRDVWALDREPELTRALSERAEAEGLTVRTVDADARSFVLDIEFGLVLAPMQLVQILGGPGERSSMLEAVRAHLAPDGLFAAALLDTPEDRPETWDATEDVPLPDVRERDGWVFSSLPLSVLADESGFTVERLRQTVSPSGALTDERHVVHLDALDPDRFESEARNAGLEPVDRSAIAQTDDHVGSTVVILRRAAATANERRAPL